MLIIQHQRQFVIKTGFRLFPRERLHRQKELLRFTAVGSVDDGQHIHFIDGGAGGYTMAAKPLKEQMALANLKSGALQN